VFSLSPGWLKPVIVHLLQEFDGYGKPDAEPITASTGNRGQSAVIPLPPLSSSLMKVWISLGGKMWTQ